MDSSRVTLRGFTTDDLPEFLELATDDEVTEFLMWDSYTSCDDAHNFLKGTAIPHPWLKAICADGNSAGSIVVDRGVGCTVRRGTAVGSTTAGSCMCRGVLGCCVARKYWGQGVATIAVRKMVAMAFAGMDIVQMEALVNQRNVASRRVLEKAGFQLEGIVFKYQLVKGELRDVFPFATYAPQDPPNRHLLNTHKCSGDLGCSPILAFEICSLSRATSGF